MHHSDTYNLNGTDDWNLMKDKLFYNLSAPFRHSYLMYNVERRCRATHKFSAYRPFYSKKKLLILDKKIVWHISIYPKYEEKNIYIGIISVFMKIKHLVFLIQCRHLVAEFWTKLPAVAVIHLYYSSYPSIRLYACSVCSVNTKLITL